MNVEIGIVVLGKMVSVQCRDGEEGRRGERDFNYELYIADFQETELLLTLTEKNKVEEPDHEHNEQEKEGNRDYTTTH